VWRELRDLDGGSRPLMVELRRFAAEALAIHHEHRAHDLEHARGLARLALEEADAGNLHVKARATRHRLSRLDRKLARKSERGAGAPRGEGTLRIWDA
jgi:hypothetical protein